MADGLVWQGVSHGKAITTSIALPLSLITDRRQPSRQREVDNFSTCELRTALRKLCSRFHRVYFAFHAFMLSCAVQPRLRVAYRVDEVAFFFSHLDVLTPSTGFKRSSLDTTVCFTIHLRYRSTPDYSSVLVPYAMRLGSDVKSS
jgi:hypothetical protein